MREIDRGCGWRARRGRTARGPAAAVALSLLGLFVACGGEQVPVDDAPADPVEGASAAGAGLLPGTPSGGLPEWIADVERGLEDVPGGAAAGRPDAGQRVVELYIGRQEYIERYYGPGGLVGGGEPLGDAVREAEVRFHALMTLTGGGGAADSAAVAEAIDALLAQYETVLEEARAAGVPLDPRDAEVRVPADSAPGGAVADRGVKAEGVRRLIADLEAVERAYLGGDRDAALVGLQRAYLEGVEPLEPLLAAGTVREIESLIHLELRPAIARGAPEETVQTSFGELFERLRDVEASAAAGTPFWLGAFNGFVIILREGLEAVLLIGAILAYLGRIPEGERHRRRVYVGVAGGVVASLLTWWAAQALIPVGAGNRELIEGVTALLAVAVLLYVSNWLFQKTYVHDWKRYLQRNVGRAATTGSALAMAALAFAAVYREGFETVLFFQALLFDVGAVAILTGLIPGLLLVLGIGFAIIRFGLRLPLRQLFAWTSVALLYIALVFLGSGLYDLQEAGLFVARPVAWAPDHPLLRQLFGFYPLGQTMVAQGLLLLFVAATFTWHKLRPVPQRAVSR